MATINPRVDQDNNVIGWQAIIRKRGFPSQTKTFRTKRDAESWSKITESEMVRGVFIQRNDAERTLLSDALNRIHAGSHRIEARCNAGSLPYPHPAGL